LSVWAICYVKKEPKFMVPFLLCGKLMLMNRKKWYFSKHKTCCVYSESCLRHQRIASLLLASSLLSRLWATWWQPNGASTGSHLENVSRNSTATACLL